MHPILLSDLVEGLRPPERFHPHRRLECRAMNLALPTLAHAIVLPGRQLKLVSQIWGPL